MSDCSELVCEYHYGDGQIVRVHACYATPADMDRRSAEFFDCFDATGVCLNEGDPWHRLPTWADCAVYVSPLIHMKGA